MHKRRVHGEVPGSSRPVDRRSYVSRMLRTTYFVLLVGLCLGAVAAHAQNATWGSTPASSDWNTASNWVQDAVPSGTATFGASNTTTITLSSTAFIGTL